MTKKFRLQFDITTESLEQLDDLMKRVGAKNRAEVVRNALRCYTAQQNQADIVHNVCQLQEDVSGLSKRMDILESSTKKD